MPLQVNARLPDTVAPEFEQWALELGLEKGALARDLLIEAVHARREGRATFERPEIPGPADLARLATKLDEQTTELDRVLRQNAKRDADLARQARDDTVGVSAARDAIAADVVSQMRAALEVIHGELVRTREELAAMLQRLPQFLGMDARLDRIEELAGRERTAKVYNIGLGDWSGSMLATAGIVMLVVGMFAYHGHAAALPERWLQIPSANRMLGGGDRAICRLVDYHYDTGLTDCHIRTAGRTVTITSMLPRAGRSGTQ